jgi:hypothetical protein
MKTVKFILPVVAIMAAVAGVFATGNSALVLPTNVTANNSSSSCIKDGTCDQAITTKKCQLASGVLFQQYVSATSCTSTISVGAFVADQPSNP